MEIVHISAEGSESTLAPIYLPLLSQSFSDHHITIGHRRDVPVGVPLDHSTPTGMTCIGTYGENCKSDNVSKYHVLLVAFLLLWHEN